MGRMARWPLARDHRLTTPLERRQSLFRMANGLGHGWGLGPSPSPIAVSGSAFGAVRCTTGVSHDLARHPSRKGVGGGAPARCAINGASSFRWFGLRCEALALDRPVDRGAADTEQFSDLEGVHSPLRTRETRCASLVRVNPGA